MALLTESWDLLWLLLCGVCTMGIAISVLGCIGDVALVMSEGAKAVILTGTSAPLAPDNNGQGAENPGGSSGTDEDKTEACSALGAGAGTDAEGIMRFPSARVRSGSGGGESISSSGSGKMEVSPGRSRGGGEDETNAAAAAAAAAAERTSVGRSDEVYSTEAQKKAIVSKLLGRFENLPSLLKEEDDNNGFDNDSDSEERFFTDTENFAKEELWQLAAEVTRKRFEQFGRELQGSLTRLDQHLDGGGLGDRRGRRKDREGGGLCAGSGGNSGMLTEEELEELELNTQALRRLSCSLKEMLRRCGGPSSSSSPMVSRGKPSFSRQNVSSNSPDGDCATAAAAVSGTLNDSCFSLPDRTNHVATAASTSDIAVGSMNKDAAASDGADGFLKGAKACGERQNPGRRISSAAPGTAGAAAASSTNQSAVAVTKMPTPVCSADGGDDDPSNALPAASLSCTAFGSLSMIKTSSPGETRVMSQRSSLNAETKRGHRGKGAFRGTMATDPTVAVAGVGTSRRCQKQEEDNGATDPSSLDGSSTSVSGATQRSDGFAVPVSSPLSTGATAEFTNPFAAPDAAANVVAAAESKNNSNSSYGGYPPYSSAIAGRCASVEPDFGVTPFGFGCFFPSPPPPPDARGNGSGDSSVYRDGTGGYVGGGGVVQEARACAPAQHLANLRALLDGDEEEQLAAVARSESSDSEDDREAGGQGTRKSGGGENGVKGKDEAGAGKGFTRT